MQAPVLGNLQRLQQEPMNNKYSLRKWFSTSFETLFQQHADKKAHKPTIKSLAYAPM
jgi:hypothetical protein